VRNPGFGEANIGAVAGAVMGAIGGLFALGIAPAIMSHNAALLVGTPILGVLSLLVCGPIGWILGGQLGPRLGQAFNNERAEAAGGILGGLIPVILAALWGWYMVTSH
jgi:hypothetical protein